jgi:hypothetical protein
MNGQKRKHVSHCLLFSYLLQLAKHEEGMSDMAQQKLYIMFINFVILTDGDHVLMEC